MTDKVHTAAVRRCFGAPVIAFFAAWSEDGARRMAWRYCKLNRIHGYRIDIDIDGAGA